MISNYILLPMQKQAFYALALGTLSLTGCTQPSTTQAAQVSAKGKDVFNGEVWLRPGKEVRYRRGGTIYLREAKPQELPQKAFSLPTLRRMFGAEKTERIIGQKKAYYISD